jgi:hypothetical protein
MKILIGTLAYRLRYDVIGRIYTQEWGRDGFDVLCAWGGDMEPGEVNRFAAITRKYQALQRKFLSGPWDALLVVEDDVLIPTHTLMRLSRLLRDGADIAYGLYVWRYENQHWWNAHPKVEEDADGVPWFWSLTQYPEEARKHWGKPIQVGGLGLGCTLISRHTLTRLSFRQGRDDHCCDTTLALDAQKDGLVQVADLGVACGHRLDSGGVIWPDPTTPTLYRIDTT